MRDGYIFWGVGDETVSFLLLLCVYQYVGSSVASFFHTTGLGFKTCILQKLISCDGKTAHFLQASHLMLVYSLSILCQNQASKAGCLLLVFWCCTASC